MKCPAIEIIRASSNALFDILNIPDLSQDFELPGYYDIWQEVILYSIFNYVLTVLKL